MFWRSSRDDSLSFVLGAWAAQPISQEQNSTTHLMSWTLNPPPRMDAHRGRHGRGLRTERHDGESWTRQRLYPTNHAPGSLHVLRGLLRRLAVGLGRAADWPSGGGSA